MVSLSRRDRSISLSRRDRSMNFPRIFSVVSQHLVMTFGGSLPKTLVMRYPKSYERNKIC